jgi:predicted dienelactone hydrolase
MQIMWLGFFLASHGYIAAAVNHHGNTGFEPKPKAQGFLLYWERSKDMKSVMDQLLLDPLFGSRIDRNRIDAAGFSLGGYTVISIASGKFSQEQYDAFCSSPEKDFTCEPQPEFPQAHEEFGELKTTNAVVQESLRHAGDSYRDDRIKAVFAMAPAFGGGFTKKGLAEIRVLVQIVIGAADSVTPLASNAKRYADMIPGAKLVVCP